MGRSKHSGEDRLKDFEGTPSKMKPAAKAFDKGSARGGEVKSAYASKASSTRDSKRESVYGVGAGFKSLIERRKKKLEEGSR